MKNLLQKALLRSKHRNPSYFSSKQLYFLRQNSNSSKPSSTPLPHKPSNASTSPFGNSPGPPLLPPDQQREFEELVRKAQAPLSTSPKTHTTGAFDSTASSGVSSKSRDGDTTVVADATAEVLDRHPDAPKRLPPEFIGDVNPKTGEIGGPKREPLKFGDWSYGGKVTDF
jgi:Protein of unknown function (DUF1674)